MVPVIYLIGGVLVQTGVRKVAERLLVAGATKATQAIIKAFKGKVQNVTTKNVNSVISSAKPKQGPRIDRQGPLKDRQGPLKDRQGPLKDRQGPNLKLDNKKSSMVPSIIIGVGGAAAAIAAVKKERSKLKDAERARSDLSSAKDKRGLARKVIAAKNLDKAQKNLVKAEEKAEKIVKTLSSQGRRQKSQLRTIKTNSSSENKTIDPKTDGLKKSLRPKLRQTEKDKPRSVSAAQKAGKLYFYNKEDEQKIAVTKEQLKKSGKTLNKWINDKLKDRKK